MLYIYQHIHFCRHLVISIGDVEIWAAWDGSMDDIQSSWDSWTRTSVLVSFGLYISRYHRSYYHSSFFHLFWLPPLLPIMVYGLAHHSDECPELRTLTKYRDTFHQPLKPPPPHPPKKSSCCLHLRLSEESFQCLSGCPISQHTGPGPHVPKNPLNLLMARQCPRADTVPLEPGHVPCPRSLWQMHSKEWEIESHYRDESSQPMYSKIMKCVWVRKNVWIQD